MTVLLRNISNDLDENLPTLETVRAAVENKKQSCKKSCLGPK